MLTIFHGEDTAASRNAYLEARKKAQDVLILDGASLTLTDLSQSLSGEDLFGSSKQIFIEELLSKKKSPKEIDSLTSLLIQSSQPVTLWESKELTVKQLSSFKGATIRVFKIPSTIFAFLDSLLPGNGRQLIELFHKTLADKEAEFVLFMLTRHVRTLLALKDNTDTTISEVSRMAPWQMGKVKKQADTFSVEDLLHIHLKLYDSDLAQKTGNLTLPLSDTIDFLLLSI